MYKYCSMSLLNYDTKLLAQILFLRLVPYISIWISSELSLPGKHEMAQ